MGQKSANFVRFSRQPSKNIFGKVITGHPRGGSRGCSVMLLEPSFGQELFHFHRDLGENLGISCVFA